MARLPRLPDLLTTANLACGVGSILLASQGQLTWACWLVFAGAVFDVFDGLAARALGQGGSEFGKQLDSLADMVTFGVAPGMLIWSGHQPGTALLFHDSTGYLPSSWGLLTTGSGLWMIACSAVMIPIASAWRLAKFNIDSRQNQGFLGLATPSNGLFWASMPLIISDHGVIHGPASDELRAWIYAYVVSRPPSILVMVIALVIFMLSEIPLPSLKFKHMKWRGNEVIYLLLVAGLVLVVLYGVLAIPLILVLYLLSPLWGRLFARTNEASSH